jgi:hypothetical protein
LRGTVLFGAVGFVHPEFRRGRNKGAHHTRRLVVFVIN